MVKQYLIFILAVCLNSCGIPKKIIKEFDSVYTDTTLNNIPIKLNGYYSMISRFERPVFNGNNFNSKYEKVIDTTYSNTIFFNDGIFISDFENLAHRSDNNYSEVDSLVRSLLLKDKEASESFYKYWKWGIYKVEDGFVKMKWVNHPPKFNPYWYSYEVWFKILDSNSLKKLCYRQLYLEPKDTNFIYTRDDDSEILTIFMGNENISKLTSANCWLKQNEWFWADKKAYKAYMKEYRRKQKK
jgi:hypothetical protein